MALNHRIQQLEIKLKSTIKQPGCDVSLFIVVPKEMQQGRFDSDLYKPTADEIDRYIKHLKDSGRCWECKGSCAIDWAPDGFKNHTLTGERSSSSSTPEIFTMSCADAEIPVLTRRIMNGEHTGSNVN